MIQRLTVIALLGLIGGGAWARHVPGHSSGHHRVAPQFVCAGSCRIGYALKVLAL